MIDAVSDLIRRGFAPVPIRAREKGPRLRNWQDLRITEIDIPDHFSNGSNVGLILGEPSGGLVDVDLDTPEAVAAAKYLLPKTGMIHGRPGSPESHWWYRTEPLPPHKQFKDPDGSVLVELRSNGQTLVPPSVHPQGESLGWKIFDAPASVSAACLQEAVKRVAAAAMLARRWPSAGSRHNAALALSGGLARLGWPAEEVASFTQAVADAASDEELRDRLRAAEDTQEAISNGDPATGWPTLSQLVGNQVVDTARECLAATGRSARTPIAIATPTEAKQEILNLVAVEDFLASHRQEPPWVLKPFATEASVGMLYGHQGRGKSSILLQLAHAVAIGEPWMGFPVEKSGPVILLETDMDHREMRFILGRAKAAGICLRNVYVPEVQPDFNILEPRDRQVLREWCDEIEPALVILDTADAGYYAPKEDNRLIMEVLTRYRKAVDPAAFFFAHHDRKKSKKWGNAVDRGDDTDDDSFLGWGQWERSPTVTSIQLALSKKPTGSRFLLKFHKHRLGHPGFKTLRLERTKHGFFEPRHDSQQMLLAWPYCLPDGERDGVLVETKTQRDVFRDIERRTDTPFETVKSQFQRGRENGAVYDWLELLP